MKTKSPGIPSASFSASIAGSTLPIAVLGALLVMFSACSQPEPIHFGAILPLTGSGSMPEVKNGMELAVSEINETGGINGSPIELHVEDSAGSATVAVEKMQQMEKDGSFLLFFSALSSVTRAVSEVAEAEGIPLIGLIATDPEIPANKRWTYVFYPDASHEAEPIFSVLLREGARTVGIVYQDDAYGRSVVQEMKLRSGRTMVTVDSHPFTGEQSELNDAVRSFMNHDAVYFVGFAANILNMHEVFAQADYEGIMLSTSTATIPSLRRDSGLDGVYVAAPLIYNESFVLAREVSQQYQDRYDQTLNHYAATGYEVINVLAGLLDGQEPDRAQVIDVLRKGFIYPGIFGEITLYAGENNMFFPLYPAVIEGKDLRYVR
ncbi:MAG: ABC transporter substrate-binding protein [Alkalispirochaeta sp.]